jgi:hypothetical protein
MADQGSASGNGELYLQTGTNAGVFLEVHTQGPVTTAASSGVPGGLSGPASGLNQLGPGDQFGYSDPAAYGTKSDGTPINAVSNAGGTSASFGPNNPSGAGNLNLFRFRNPA